MNQTTILNIDPNQTVDQIVDQIIEQYENNQTNPTIPTNTTIPTNPTKQIYQIISDIHLEFNNTFSAKKLYNNLITSLNNTDLTQSYEYNLILAGDIGYPTKNIYKAFLKSCVQYYDNVFLIAGNHEFYESAKYDMSYSDIIQLIQSICDEINIEPNKDIKGRIHFMNNNILKHNNVYLIGSILWSNIKKENYSMAKYINDYNMIKNFTPEISNELFEYNYKFISESLEYVSTQKMINPNIKCFVITHHMPSMSLIDSKYKKYGEMNSFFASNCDKLMTDTNTVDYWIYGHTHTAKQTKINDTILICNPKGYPSEISNYSTIYIGMDIS
jgi:predicted phosphodiesterase